jgi:hypothetical protein
MPSERVFKDTEVPQQAGSMIPLYVARNEFEPFQVIVKPASSGNATVTMGDFGSGITTELYQVKYVNITTASDGLGKTGDYPDPLWPLESGDNIQLTAAENTAIWISVFVSSSTASGDYQTNLTIAGIDVPVSLHVFNFTLSDSVHIESQMNISYQNILTKYGVMGVGSEYWMYVNKIKQYLKDHRLTPKSVLWPGGLTTTGASPYIDYDCNGQLSDIYGEWGFEEPAKWYLDGDTLRNDVGFPSFMAATFTNNDASSDQRPPSFCGETRTSADWYTADNPNSPYNVKWSQYMQELQNYLNRLGYLDKAYYYIANEPQNQAGYDAVAWYSGFIKQTAPDLKLMLSENPRAEIFDHSNYTTDAQIDIWLAWLNQYNPQVSHDREKNHGEKTWIYFLEGTKPPYFNPITLDHPGIESKFTGWFLWKYRIKGIAYYAMNDWSLNPWSNPLTNSQNGARFLLYPPSETNSDIVYGSNNHRLVPSIRLELMRDGLEDYEYLYILNGNRQPQIDVNSPADSQANKIISALTGYTRDSEFMYNLRRVIGQKNGGEISVLPDIYPAAAHPRAEGPPGNYYINFQDPDGEPMDDPLIVNAKTYMKIGWMAYEADDGYGWYGDMVQTKYQYLSEGPNELQKSILYDDWGKRNTFEFDLPPGSYTVTVSVGWAGRTYNRHYIAVEGTVFIDDEATVPEQAYLVRTKDVTISDSKLTMEMGIEGEYTMLNFLDIEAVSTPIGINPMESVPYVYHLGQNYPNPFNPKTIINYELEIINHVDLNIYNLLGQKVATLVSDRQKAGYHQVVWDATGFASGVYLYRIMTDKGFVDTKKLLLLK